MKHVDDKGRAGEVLIDIVDWPAAQARVMPLRIRVFVVEQGVPADIELDEFDPQSRHAVAADAGGSVIATGRLLPDGHIGRMAVDAAWRGRGVGGAVLEALVIEAGARGMAQVLLNAQLQALDFYRRHGFEEYGEVFVEAGIPHRAMRRMLAERRDGTG
ncbi:GNAT family N-acetyltransferase [Thauera sp. SDU_THAU2]|uniref:GNAT family N-acetyltransferase n=1 Tax=Thauera sp. SDU_THAU2 TaxID=3136633 RepID=UPI00311ED687